MIEPNVATGESSMLPGEKPAIIQLRRVVKQYHTGGGVSPALKGVDLDIHAGELVGIIGKSGAGKTTLVNMIAGIDHPTSGTIVVDGVQVHTMREDRLALWRGRSLGVIYQNFQLMPTLSLLNNIMLPMDLCGLWQPKNSPQRALELLREVELEEHGYKLPSAISGGQQQRVAIARALANDPPIIIADEPTGRLDSVTAETILRIFFKLAERGKTLVIVTHDESLARRVSRLIRISDGQVREDGRP